MKKHHYTHTTIEHHDDGSHTMTHHHKDGKSHKKYAVHSLDHAHDAMQANLGTPNPGEAAADAGNHGIPAPVAAAAGVPAPGGAPAGAPPAMPGM